MEEGKVYMKLLKFPSLLEVSIPAGRCLVHSKKTGLGCSRDPNHLGKHSWELECICGSGYCNSARRRILKALPAPAKAV